MTKITEYLRLLLFCAAMLAGLQVPSFVDQYHKSLIAHTSEAELALAEFRKDAEHYFNGSLENLIQHYLNSPDPVFNAGGRNIQAIYTRYQLLKQALNEFGNTVYSPYYQTMVEPVPDIQQEVWANFTHTVVLNRTSIIVGIISGFVPLLLLAFCGQLFKTVSRLAGFTKPTSSRRATNNTKV